ncbi:hypothetical protein [Natronomonas sp. EA1]|uniref:hypothetical protein n=1 Tax=Natronomonas sp. EA1 TaxID=3421655 RepID=UPI003EBF3EB5
MSLFTDVGRTFEKTKQAFFDGKDAYVCTACGERLSEDHDHCPNCGEASVEPVE